VQASAGKRDKLDAQVLVDDDPAASREAAGSAAAPGLGYYRWKNVEIMISSPVASLFGAAQKTAVQKVLDELGFHKGRVEVCDNQAVDAVLRARTRAAVLKLYKLRGESAGRGEVV
jgi:citrate lyase acyl carrier protein